MIRALCGTLSGGKTLNAVKLVIERHKQTKKRIISNIRLYYVDYTYMSNLEFANNIYDNYEDENKINDLFGNAIILLDEITHLVSARKSSTDLNEKITSFMMYIGKLNSDLIYTCQSYDSMTDLRLRNVTSRVGECIRMKEDKGELVMVSDIEDRKISNKVWILVIWEINSIFGNKDYEVELNDLEKYYKYYNTGEMLFLDRVRFLKR